MGLFDDWCEERDLPRAVQKLKRLEANAQSVTRAASTQWRAIHQLTEEVARQKLAITALTRFIISKGLIAEEELAAFMREVDAEDGAVDGRMPVDVEDGRTRPGFVMGKGLVPLPIRPYPPPRKGEPPPTLRG